MNDSPAALAAPFASPLSPIDMVPAIRWAFVEAGTSAHLVEVMHYREDGGSFRMHHTVVTAERNGRSWEIDTYEGEDLDYASLDLLAADLTRERAGRPCFCRIDECDMASERIRMQEAA